MTFSGFLHFGLSFLCSLICFFFPSRAEKNDSLCLPRLAKTLGNFERDAPVACHFLPHISTHRLDVCTLLAAMQPLTRTVDRDTVALCRWNAHIFLTMLLKQEKNPDKVMQGVRRDTSSGYHFKMTGFPFPKKNARAGVSSAAFLTVWTGAREG